MGLIREDPLSRDLIVVAEKRANRPHSAPTPKKTDAACPFCPGNEKMTPPTIMQFGKPSWSVRCFRNKFPVFSGGQGRHEVVVETPRHSAALSGLPKEHIEKVLRAYSERSDWMLSHGMEYALVCKNEGANAGASLSHPHSQIFGMPFIPPRVLDELALIRAYRKTKRRCLLCDEAKKAGKRKIIETEDFVVVAPCAPRWQYESRIMPKRHAGRLSELDLPELAYVLKTLLSAYDEALCRPAYNYYIHSAPKGDRAMHLHIDFFPRLSVPAGLEEGAGIFINQTPTEKAAGMLREKIKNGR